MSNRFLSLVLSPILILLASACSSGPYPLAFFEESQFCQLYACELETAYAFPEGGINHVYDTDIEPKVVVEIITSEGKPVEYYLVFMGRSGLAETDLEMALNFLQVVQPDVDLGEEGAAFILDQSDRFVNHVCEAESIPFGEWRLYVARYDNPLLLVAKSCPQ